MTDKKDSILDGLVRGIGRRLGQRRKEVHDAIDRFHEELDKDEDGADALEKSRGTPRAERAAVERNEEPPQDEEQVEVGDTK